MFSVCVDGIVTITQPKEHIQADANKLTLGNYVKLGADTYSINGKDMKGRLLVGMDAATAEGDGDVIGRIVEMRTSHANELRVKLLPFGARIKQGTGAGAGRGPTTPVVSTPPTPPGAATVSGGSPTRSGATAATPSGSAGLTSYEENKVRNASRRENNLKNLYETISGKEMRKGELTKVLKNIFRIAEEARRDYTEYIDDGGTNQYVKDTLNSNSGLSDQVFDYVSEKLRNFPKAKKTSKRILVIPWDSFTNGTSASMSSTETNMGIEPSPFSDLTEALKHDDNRVLFDMEQKELAQKIEASVSQKVAQGQSLTPAEKDLHDALLETDGNTDTLMEQHGTVLHILANPTGEHSSPSVGSAQQKRQGSTTSRKKSKKARVTGDAAVAP